MSRSYNKFWFNLSRWVDRLPRPSHVLTVVALLAVLCILGIGSSQKLRLPQQQSLALSVVQSQLDSQNQPTPQPRVAKKPATVPVVAPWQGPIAPLTTSPSPTTPIFNRLPINEPVVFLGIDDGWFQSPENLHWLKSHHLPFTLFVVDSQIRDNYGYFRQLQNAGMSIEDHSVSHPDFTKLDLATQQDQICSAADSFGRVFGQRPSFFRPPYGNYNVLTQQAAAACGIKAIITWRATLFGGNIQFQNPETRLRPGDIILAHFQTDLIANMAALNTELQRDHLQIGRLEDWLR